MTEAALPSLSDRRLASDADIYDDDRRLAATSCTLYTAVVRDPSGGKNPTKYAITCGPGCTESLMVCHGWEPRVFVPAANLPFANPNRYSESVGRSWVGSHQFANTAKESALQV